MLGRIGMPELIVILLVFILLFGARKLPELAKGLAQAINIFKKEAKGIKESLDADVSPQDKAEHTTVEKNISNDFDPDKPKRDWRSEIKSEDQETSKES